MELDLTDAVATHANPAELWGRLLDASAVITLLGGDAADIRPLGSSAGQAGEGHTFRIKGVGGGLFHARIDERAESERVSYVVWNDKTPETPILLAYAIDSSGDGAVLTAQLTTDMPLEDVIGSFGILGIIILPFAPDLLRGYVSRQLRKQLMAIVEPAGSDSRGYLR